MINEKNFLILIQKSVFDLVPERLTVNFFQNDVCPSKVHTTVFVYLLPQAERKAKETSSEAISQVVLMKLQLRANPEAKGSWSIHNL